jgi:predicted nucleic acid-binding protein
MIVLDTNVVSELMKGEPSTGVMTWVRRQPVPELYTTSITEAEIFYGIELLAGKRREALLEAAEGMFAEDFANRTLAFDSEAARAFARLAASARRTGRPRSQADMEIAAIALARGARLATRNVGDFKGCGLELVDPWSR